MSDYLNYVTNLSRLDNIKDIKTLIAKTHEEYKKPYDDVYKDVVMELEKTLKHKVEEMHKVKEPFFKGLAKQSIFEWCSNFIGDKNEINKQIELYSIERKPYELYNIHQLLQKKKENDSNYIVKGLIKRGALYLVAAAPKIGKSLAVTNLGVKVSRGENFLNRITEKGNVLYIQNEEQIERQTVDRVYYNGLQMLEVENNAEYKKFIESDNLLISKNLDIVEDEETIVEIIKEKNISLLLIDSLGASLKKSGLDEYSKELTPALYRLQSHCHNLNFTCILIHHSTKLDDPKDKKSMLNGIAGTSAIPRANDGVIRLFQNKNDENVIDLKTIPREGTPVNLSIKLIEDEACYWNFAVEKETTLTPEAIDLQNQILRLLYDRYDQWVNSLNIPLEGLNLVENPVFGLTLKELMNITELEKHVIVKRLNDMIQTEGITFTPSTTSRAHIYHIHFAGESWMKIYLEIEDQKKEEEKIAKEERKKYNEYLKNLKDRLLMFIDRADYESFNDLNKSLPEKEQKDISKKLTDEDFLHIAYVKDIKPKFKKGEPVKDKEGNIHTIANITYERDVAKNLFYGYYKYYINSDINIYFTEEDLTHENDS